MNIEYTTKNYKIGLNKGEENTTLTIFNKYGHTMVTFMVDNASVKTMLDGLRNNKLPYCKIGNLETHAMVSDGQNRINAFGDLRMGLISLLWDVFNYQNEPTK